MVIETTREEDQEAECILTNALATAWTVSQRDDLEALPDPAELWKKLMKVVGVLV